MTWVVMCAAGCTNFGTGDTGELVIPDARLNSVTQLELPIAETSTRPGELPTSRPDAFANMAALPLTIENARALALENNLTLKVALYDPAVAAESLNAEQARFEGLFRLQTSYSDSDAPVASSLNGSRFNGFNITPSFIQPLITGGSFTASLPLNRSETDNSFSLLNPSYTSDVALAFTQPLLRGAGTDANALGIRLAFYGKQQTAARTKLTVIRLLADTDRAYWRLFAARNVLEVRRAEYQLAVEQLNRAGRRVKAGDAAEVEILRAESSVADTLQSIITAENRTRDAQRNLKRVLNVPGLSLGGMTRIDPDTRPIAFRFVADGEQLANDAMAQRMELLELELQIAAETAQVMASRNAALPVVSLSYQYNVNGLGGSFNDSIRQVGDWDYEDHSVGLTVEVPIGNEGARSRLRSSLLRRLQTLSSYDDRAQQIRLEVLGATDALDTLWQTIVAARQRVLLNQRLYDAEVRQFDVGLRTSTEVREAQNRLANARADEISAVADYQIARVDLAFATGNVLGSAAVDWQAAESPDVGYFGQE